MTYKNTTETSSALVTSKFILSAEGYCCRGETKINHHINNKPNYGPM